MFARQTTLPPSEGGFRPIEKGKYFLQEWQAFVGKNLRFKAKSGGGLEIVDGSVGTGKKESQGQCALRGRQQLQGTPKAGSCPPSDATGGCGLIAVGGSTRISGVGPLVMAGDARGSTSDAEQEPVCLKAPVTPNEELEKTELDLIAEGESRKPQPLGKTAVKLEIEEMQ